MGEARVTGVYENTSQGFVEKVPFGLTGDYISMHSGINLERLLKIGALKLTFIIKDLLRLQVKIYEIYLDGSKEYTAAEYNNRKDLCYIVETIIGNEAYLQYITTAGGVNIVTADEKALVLFSRTKQLDSHFATVKLYLGAIKNSNLSFTSTNPQPQKICEVNNLEYYGIQLASKNILKNGTDILYIKEVYES